MARERKVTLIMSASLHPDVQMLAGNLMLGTCSNPAMDWQPNYKIEIEIEIEIGMNYPCVDHLTQSKLYLLLF